MTKLIPYDPDGNRKPKKPQDGSDPAEHVHYHYYDQRTFQQEGPPSQIDDNDKEGDEEPEPILAPWQKYLFQLIGALSILGLLAYFGGTSSTVTTNTVETMNAAPTGADRPADGGLPSVSELLANNDPRACEHPETVAFIRSRVLPQPEDTSDGLSGAEFQRALQLARTDLTEVSAAQIKPDVHEITCEANLRYGDGERDAMPIAFKMRASADPNGPAIYYFQPGYADRLIAAALIMKGPIDQVKSERPALSPQDQDPPPDPVATPDPVGADAGSDAAAFAPR